MRAISILLVDDNPEFLKSATHMLASFPDIEIAGVAHSGEEAISLVSQLDPDVVLMDVAMPGMNGFQATRALKSRFRALRVIILTLYDTPEYRDAAAKVSADGFVAKSELADQLPEMLRTLMQMPANLRFFSPQTSERLKESR